MSIGMGKQMLLMCLKVDEPIEVTWRRLSRHPGGPAQACAFTPVPTGQLKPVPPRPQ
jgi:hypothetical protein